MQKIHVINPAAGHGKAEEVARNMLQGNEQVYRTTGVGDAARFVQECCESNPSTHFIVYGGDGTAQEAAAGILKAGAGQSAKLSVVPVGTGNDLLRSFEESGKVHTIDALTVNGGYALNIVNVGFDSLTVEKTQRYKKILPGTAAYIAGLIDTLLHKLGHHWRITIENEHGETEHLDGDYILALCANCKSYGGGFFAAPLADPKDGLIDFMAVKTLSRLTFLRFVSLYKAGKHMDAATEDVTESLQHLVIYRRCKRVKIEGLTSFCADGEVQPTSEIEVSILPKAIQLEI